MTVHAPVSSWYWRSVIKGSGLVVSSPRNLPKSHRTGSSPDPAGRFDPQALLCTDLAADPAQILAWFVLRWQLEVTLEEVRRHLGVETQRQWSDLAIRRTTPALLGLFSLITLLAHRRMMLGPTPVRQAAWYPKQEPTFADALALVRRDLWTHQAAFCMSHRDRDIMKVPRALIERLTEAMCYAA